MKRIVLFCLFFSFGVGAWAELSMSSRQTADSIVSDAKKFIGRPYKYGGNGPYVFDCTGFTRYIYANYGYTLARSATGVAAQGKPIATQDLQKGDIVLYDGRRGNHVCGHVGIFMDWDDSLHTSFHFIHAASRGVQITHSTEAYYAKRYMGARRFLPDFLPLSFAPDSTAAYPFDSVAKIQPDMLELDSADQRIVLFANGKWAIVTASGELQIPDDTTSLEQIVLSPTGDWGRVKQQMVAVPEQPVNWVPSGSAPAPTVSGTASSAPQYHTVRQGETLSSIARKYGTNVKTLCRLNNIRENAIIRIGQKIRVK